MDNIFEQEYYYCLNCGNIHKDAYHQMYCEKCHVFDAYPGSKFLFTNYLFRNKLSIIEYLFKKHLDRKLNWHSKPVFIWNRASKEQVKNYITARLV